MTLPSLYSSVTGGNMALFEVNSSRQLSVDLPRVMFYGCLVTEMALVLDLMSSCISTFDCNNYWPTLSYMGSFKDHDRLFMFALTWQAVVLAFFYVAAYSLHNQVLGRLNHSIMLLIGLTTAFALPWVGYIDEVTPNYLIPTEKIHLVLVVGFTTLTLLWVWLSIDCMRAAWKTQYIALLRYQILGIALVAASFYQWKYAYTQAAYTSEALEALTEWVAVSVAVFAPYMYTRAFLDLNVSLRFKLNSI